MKKSDTIFNLHDLVFATIIHYLSNYYFRCSIPNGKEREVSFKPDKGSTTNTSGVTASFSNVDRIGIDM